MRGILHYLILSESLINFPIGRQGNMFVTKIPKGFPWQETVLLLGTDFVTKTKDVPVRKGLQNLTINSTYS